MIKGRVEIPDWDRNFLYHPFLVLDFASLQRISPVLSSSAPGGHLCGFYRDGFSHEDMEHAAPCVWLHAAFTVEVRPRYDVLQYFLRC